MIGAPAWLDLPGPPPEVIAPVCSDLEIFVCKLAQLRLPEGTWATSWYRSPERNRKVGGHPESQHQWGLAVDLVVPKSEQFALQNQLRELGLVFVIESDHIHIQYAPAGFAVAMGLSIPRA